MAITTIVQSFQDSAINKDKDIQTTVTAIEDSLEDDVEDIVGSAL